MVTTGSPVAASLYTSVHEVCLVVLACMQRIAVSNTHAVRGASSAMWQLQPEQRTTWNHGLVRGRKVQDRATSALLLAALATLSYLYLQDTAVSVYNAATLGGRSGRRSVCW